MRPVDGDEVLRKIEREIAVCNSGLAKGILEFLRAQIKSMPTLEVAPVKYGEWTHNIHTDDSGAVWHSWKCSVCGAPREFYSADECHVCGAKTRGET